MTEYRFPPEAEPRLFSFFCYILFLGFLFGFFAVSLCLQSFWMPSFLQFLEPIVLDFFLTP